MRARPAAPTTAAQSSTSAPSTRVTAAIAERHSHRRAGRRSGRSTRWLRDAPAASSCRRPLLQRALTHRSYAYENGGLPTNERLEFLGDSVLGLVVTDALYRSHPDLPEGQLAKLRAAVVNMRALADVGPRRSASATYLLLGRGEESTGGRDKSSILADTLEARASAPSTSTAAWTRPPTLVHRLFDPLIDEAATLGAGLDWKTSLQELTAAPRPRRPRVPRHRGRARTTRSLHRRGPVGGEVLRRRAPAAARRRPSRRPPRPPGGTCAPAPPRRRPSRAGRRARPRVPELPEVEVVRRGLERGSPAAPIAAVEVLHPRAVRRHVAGAGDFAARLRRPHARRRAAAAASTCGCRCDADGRRQALVAHLGMSGQLLRRAARQRRDETAPAGPARPSPTTARELRFVDQRTFGGLARSLDLAVDGRARRRSPTSPATRSTRPSTRRPSSPRCAAGDTGLKRALLDQTLVSRHRQHLRRRGAVAGPAALRPGAPTRCPGRRRRRARRTRASVMGEALAAGRHLLRRALRQRQRRERLLRPLAARLRPDGRAVRPLRARRSGASRS